MVCDFSHSVLLCKEPFRGCIASSVRQGACSKNKNKRNQFERGKSRSSQVWCISSRRWESASTPTVPTKHRCGEMYVIPQRDCKYVGSMRWGSSGTEDLRAGGALDFSALQQHKVASQGGDSSRLGWKKAQQSSGKLNNTYTGQTMSRARGKTCRQCVVFIGVDGEEATDSLDSK